MWKFLHAADVHLDSPLLRLGQYDDAPAETLRTATRQALIRLVDLALEEQVAFVLVAGDLYDGDWEDARTGLFVVRQWQRLREASIPVFLIAGNHDAANRITKNVPLPDNAVVLDHRRPETRILDEWGVAIHGQGFATQSVRENLAAGFPPREKNLFNIGLLHTNVDGHEGHDPYCPCSLDDLKAKGYDYWALGHIHKREVLCQEPFIAYAGNLQGRHIGESGPKGAYLVTVNEGRVHAEFRELDVVRWERLTLAAERVASRAELGELFRQELERLVARHADRPLAVRVEFTGVCPLFSQLLADPRRHEDDLRAIAIATGRDQIWLEKVKFLVEPPDDSAGSDADGPLAVVDNLVAEYLQNQAALERLAAELRDLQDKLPSELAREAVQVNVTDATWIREALRAVGPLLRERLQRHGGET